MLAEVLGIVLGTLLLVVLPGFLLVQAVFPPARSSLTRLERGYLAVAGGILLLILVGSILGFLPHGERGFFTNVRTGFPNVELALLAVSLALFWAGLARGAYPRVAARYPRLATRRAVAAPVRERGP